MPTDRGDVPLEPVVWEVNPDRIRGNSASRWWVLPTSLVVGVPLATCALMMVCFLGLGFLPEQRGDRGRSDGPVVGEEATLGEAGASGAYVARSDEAYEAMISAFASKDDEELDILVKRGRIVYVRGGSRAKVIGTGVFSRRVRIRGGLFDGVEGWTPKESVHRFQP